MQVATFKGPFVNITITLWCSHVSANGDFVTNFQCFFIYIQGSFEV